MKSQRNRASKELYAALRQLSRDELWGRERANFDRAAPPERLARVSVIRAISAAFAGGGSTTEKDEVRAWLRGLLRDPQEKVRRYAIGALPKLGAGEVDEKELLLLLESNPSERERQSIAEALDKIGGDATLSSIHQTGDALPRRTSAGQSFSGQRLLQTQQKIQARLERTQEGGGLNLTRVLEGWQQVIIQLRSRKGLERIVREEVQHGPVNRLFRVVGTQPTFVTIQALGAFALNDIYRLRCFGTAGVVLGTTRERDAARAVEALAFIIASARSEQILDAFTEGALRYRLAFAGHGHQRALVRVLANRVYAINPRLLNDPQRAPWTLSIVTTEAGQAVEASPKLTPDPRYGYRQEEVPAASHPALAACLARLSGLEEGEVVWDPFCGSGLELVERVLLGGVKRIYGTDLSAAAVEAAQANLAAVALGDATAEFHQCDFREFERTAGMKPGTLTLMLTNPPLGKRVPVSDLRQLIKDVFTAAARVLRPGGRLVLVNPVRLENPHPALKLQFREVVDVGIMEARLEKYVRVAR